MSNINKQELRERYSEKPAPKCHICGAVMTMQRISGSRVTYACSGAIYDEAGCHYAAGRSLADDHYEQSRVTVTDDSDPDVLALLDELEAKDRRIEEEIGRANREHHRGFMMACGHLKQHSSVHYADAAEMEIAALRERIAELEAREVVLPRSFNREIFGEGMYEVPNGNWMHRKDVTEALEAAGIITKVGE